MAAYQGHAMPSDQASSSSSSSSSNQPGPQTPLASTTFRDIYSYLPLELTSITDDRLISHLDYLLYSLINDHGESPVQEFYSYLLQINLVRRTRSDQMAIIGHRLTLPEVCAHGGENWRDSKVHRRIVAQMDLRRSSVTSGSRHSVGSSARSSGNQRTASSACGVRSPDGAIYARLTLTRLGQTIQYCVPSLVSEYKPDKYPLFDLLCQIVAYGSQLYWSVGTYLALMARRESFGRILILTEGCVAVEVTQTDQHRIMQIPADSGTTTMSGSLFDSICQLNAPIRTLTAVKPLFLGRNSIKLPNKLVELHPEQLPSFDSAAMSRWNSFIGSAVNLLLPMRIDQPLETIRHLSDNELSSVMHSLGQSSIVDASNSTSLDLIASTLRPISPTATRKGKGRDNDAKHRSSPATSRETDQARQSDQPLPTPYRDTNDNKEDNDSEDDELTPFDSVSQSGAREHQDVNYESCVGDCIAVFLTSSQMDNLVDGLLKVHEGVRQDVVENLGDVIAKELNMLLRSQEPGLSGPS